MRILSVYSPADAGIIRLWERSWRSNGWKPGLITPKELQEHTPREAAKARRARFVYPLRLINFGFRPPRNWPTVKCGKLQAPKNLPFKRYGSVGWQHAQLVLFPADMTEAQILAVRPE